MFTERYSRRKFFCCFATILICTASLAGCGNIEPEEGTLAPLPASFSGTSTSLNQAAFSPTVLPAILQPTPSPFLLGPLSSSIDLHSGPIEVPIELRIPSLKINAPVLGVGLNDENEMDAPEGSPGDPIWEKVFWFRGGGVPGDVGTATIAGHIDDTAGKATVFIHLKDLKPGDEIIIHSLQYNMDIRFLVDEVKNYSLKESSRPEVLMRIFGEGPVTGQGPQPSRDGLAHLTLITCAGFWEDGRYNQHTVVFATRR